MRETFLDGVLWTTQRRVLNTMQCTEMDDSNIVNAITACIIEMKKSAVVTEAGVRYSGLQQSDEFRNYCMQASPCLKHFDPNTLPSHQKRLAFWINLYNLLVIDAVIRLDISTSVTEGWLGVFRFFRRAAYNVNGLRFSLEDIEHGVLRANHGVPYFPGVHFSNDDPRREFVLKKFDPRVHFALNCASRSCPPIAFYEAEKLDREFY
jgi:hypothetical protein